MAPARPIPELTCDESFRSAAGKVIWTRFEEMMSFRDSALEGRDIDGVHDMRVAARRLRAAMELFSDAFPRRRFKRMLRSVKGLADALGGVRDLDVMIKRLEEDLPSRPPAQALVLEEMLDDFKRQRKGARAELKAVITRLESESFSHSFLSTVAREVG